MPACRIRLRPRRPRQTAGARGSASPSLPGVCPVPSCSALTVPVMTQPVFDALRPSTLGHTEQSGAAAGVSLVSLKSWPRPPGRSRERLPAMPRARGRSVLCPVPREPSWSPAGGGETSATDVQTQFLVRTAPSHKNCVWTIRSGDSRPGLAGSSRGNLAGAWKRRTHGP